MRKNFGAKPFLYPQPVLIIATYGEDGTPDAMNAAWGGIADTKQIAVSYTHLTQSQSCFSATPNVQLFQQQQHF